MNAPINQRLSRIEDEFRSAATQGGFALTSFHDKWSSLFLDIEHAVQTGSLDKDTMSIGNVVASRIATMSDCLLDFQTSVDVMSEALHGELSSIFARVHIDDKHTVSKFTSHGHPGTPNSDSYSDPRHPDRMPYPPYIELAYKWLLANLHNPYPSKNTRNEISRKTVSDRKVIDAWFVDARRRMGWNALRKSCFSNKRVDIVDAATRFFVLEDDKRPLDPDVELKFAAIESCAKDLYSDKFSKSTLATKLDVAVKDMTPETKAQAKENERCRRQEEKEKQAERSVRDALAISSYPSPDYSPKRTPEPSFPSPSVSTSEVDIQSQSHPRTSNKRHASPVAEIGAMDRPNKRHRSDSLSSAATTTPIGLPSPAPSSQESCESSPPATATPTIPYISSRKRRSSDADLDIYHAPKRPCNLPVWPRPHAVSNPLPLSSTFPELSSIDDWFEKNFGIPKPVSVEVPDESIPVEVGLFDYSTINSGALPDIFDPSTRSTEQYVDHNIPPATEQFTLNQVPSYGLEICTNDFNFDELFCGPEDTTPELSGGNLPQGSFDIPPSFDLAPNSFDPTSFSSIFFPDPTVDTAAIADLSIPISHNPASSIQWTFPPITSAHNLLGPLDELQTPGLNFAQDGSFMFDPSILGLYTTGLPGDGLPQSSIPTDKAAKQRKLLEMQEAARQLAAEIAASSVF